jgi:hypothetical protein
LRLLYADFGQMTSVVASYRGDAHERIDAVADATAAPIDHQPPPPMLATILAELMAPRRAAAIALLWLLALTIVNVQTGGAYRSTLLFAVPIAIVAWADWHLAFLFAALAVIAAKFGGAMPEPGSTSPLWLDAMLAFLKLSIDAVVVNAWGRRHRRRDAPGRAPEDLTHNRGD